MKSSSSEVVGMIDLLKGHEHVLWKNEGDFATFRVRVAHTKRTSV